MAEELSPKEQYEQMKAKKEVKRKKQSARSKTKNTARKALITIAIIVLLGGGVYALVEVSTPDSPDLSRGFESQGRAHIASTEHPAYNSNPPTSGWHYAQTAPLGFHEEHIDDEAMVHNLEHGEIWISYQPDVSEQIKQQLREFADDRGNVVITPREENDTDIAVAAWQRLDTFDVEGDVLPIQRIEDFITRYQNRAPESPGGGFNPHS